MKKRPMAVAFLAVLLLLSSCAAERMPADASGTSEASLSKPEEKAVPSVSLYNDGTNSPFVSETDKTAVETEESDTNSGTNCAFITGMSMRMDGGTDITFDYVDWLSGDAARDAYIEDHPGATEEEMEAAGLFEIGYIRNIDPTLHTYPTGEATEYYLPDPDNIAQNVPVSYEVFLGRMYPAVDEGEEAYLTFVRVCVQDGSIQSVEWLYRP